MPLLSDATMLPRGLAVFVWAQKTVLAMPGSHFQANSDYLPYLQLYDWEVQLEELWPELRSHPLRRITHRDRLADARRRLRPRQDVGRRALQDAQPTADDVDAASACSSWGNHNRGFVGSSQASSSNLGL